jgi:hypothetical protein
MEFWTWTAQSWFDFFSVVGIVGGLYYNAAASRKETKSRQVATELDLAKNHQRLWQDYYHQPTLYRVLEAAVDVKKQPVKPKEAEFVNLVVQHLYVAFRAMQNGLIPRPKALRREVWDFFSLPVPRTVWELVKVVQDDDFAAFVESCLNQEPLSTLPAFDSSGLRPGCAARHTLGVTVQ